MVQLPGLSVWLQSYGNQSLDFQEVEGDDHLSLSFILEASAPVRVDGGELAPGRLLSRAGREQTAAVIAPETRSLILGLDPELVGGRRAPLGIVSAAEPSRRELIASCRLLVEVARAALPAPDSAEARLRAARERVIRAVGALLADGLRPEAVGATERERFQIVERARERMQQTRGKLPVAGLARELAVSERALYRAFQQCLGMGPAELEQLRRLHDFRTRLVARGPGRGRIAEAAAECGFHHLGRLSGLYRAHFGELPTETLRRNGNATAAE